MKKILEFIEAVLVMGLNILAAVFVFLLNGNQSDYDKRKKGDK